MGPLLFIGLAVATGGAGAVKTINAGIGASNAKAINQTANEIVDASANQINAQRKACEDALCALGEEKIAVLNESMVEFLDTFTKIKNVDFRESVGLEELSKLQIDQKEFEELKVMTNFAVSLAGGIATGGAGGALAAFGAYGAAQALACASTGTAISALSGAAATNATLAFFGGGSLAAGGLGMAGGTVVLGGLVAGPALLIMGLITENAAQKELDIARTNKAQALQIAAELEKATLAADAIRRRSYMFYNLLAGLDSYFVPLIYKMKEIVLTQGEDYRYYDAASKRVIASCASIAVAIKAVLDTPLLTDDGLLDEGTDTVVQNVAGVLQGARG